MAIQLENDTRDDSYFQQNLSIYYRFFLKQLKQTSQSFVHFHLTFCAIFLIELTLFASFSSFFIKSSILAYSLSAIFLTCFSYFVLLFYFQAQKTEQLTSIKNQFLTSCRQALPDTESYLLEKHLSLAEALCKLSQYLQDFEWDFYKIPSHFQWISSFISRLSAYYYWNDVFTMKQLLLQAAIEEHIEQIKNTPTNLEVHASLANTYIALSKLYRKPVADNHPKAHSIRKRQADLSELAKTYSRLAVEEFKILNHYASNDPWIHEQMALGYRDLNIPEEEIKETETLLKLRPQDKDILFQLGTLYFQQGLNAKGLQTYEELKRTHLKKAEELISSYGTLVTNPNTTA